MKQFKWPRPPLILGVVLGDTIERYMFISIERYGMSWLLRPVVAVLFLMAIVGLVRPLLQDIRSQGGVRKMLTSFQAPQFHPSQLFTVFMIMRDRQRGRGGGALGLQRQDRAAGGRHRRPDGGSAQPVQRHVPQAGGAGDGRAGGTVPARGGAEDPHGSDAPTPGICRCARSSCGRAWFFGYLIGFMAVMAVIGLIPTVAIFVVFFMRWEARERWTLVIPYAVTLVLFIWFTFDYIMAVPWPPTLLGQWFPAFKAIPSV